MSFSGDAGESGFVANGGTEDRETSRRTGRRPGRPRTVRAIRDGSSLAAGWTQTTVGGRRSQHSSLPDQTTLTRAPDEAVGTVPLRCGSPARRPAHPLDRVRLPFDVPECKPRARSRPNSASPARRGPPDSHFRPNPRAHGALPSVESTSCASPCAAIQAQPPPPLHLRHSTVLD